jgi:YD repeat-containing protein
VRALRINHVSVNALDLEESARFYEALFGMERIPTPLFPDGPVLWLRVGDQQLHLFERKTDAPPYHHLAFDVDDFEAVYLKARELGLLDPGTFGTQIREHPAGWVQMYLRDPAGNLIEIDWPDASSLDRSVVTGIRALEDDVAQTGPARTATVYTAAP